VSDLATPKWEIYNNVCKGRFQNMEDKLDKVEDKVDKLTAIVTNGLSSKVNAIWGWMVAIIVGLISVMGLTIYDLIVNHVIK